MSRVLSCGYSVVTFTFIASLLFRDLSIDHAAGSMDDCATYYRLTFEIPSPFFEVIFGTQAVLLFYLVGRILAFRKLLDEISLVLYTLIILIYIMFELPTIQLFAVHHKKAEADFIKKYHLVMFALCVACIALQIYAHSTPDRPHQSSIAAALTSKNSFIAGARRQPTQANLLAPHVLASAPDAVHTSAPSSSASADGSEPTLVLRRSVSSNNALQAQHTKSQDPMHNY